MERNTAILLFLLHCFPVGKSSWSNTATSLRNRLKGQTDIHVRPDELTTINITFVLTSLNKLDSVSQELSTTFLLYMTWTDLRLKWTPAGNEPEDLVFYVNEVWTPPLVVNNAIEDAIFLLKDDIVPLRVSHDGTVTWVPRVSPTTTCNVDISNFPVDSQTCHIHITSWIHSTSELDLIASVTDHYKRNVTRALHNDQAWKLLDANVEPESLSGAYAMEYKNMKYTFHFRRQERFYWVLLIAPFGCIAFLMALVFLVPSHYQEFKVSYSVTLLLSFQLYLSLLQSLLPPVFNEQKVNILGEYVSAVMVYGSIITAVLLIQLPFVYILRRRHKRSKCTGTISGTISGTASAVLSGTLQGDVSDDKPVLTGNVTVCVDETNSKTGSFMGSVSVQPTKRPSKSIICGNVVDEHKMTMMRLTGMMTSPGEMKGTVTCYISGLIVNNEITEGNIAGRLTSRLTLGVPLTVIDVIFSGICFGVSLVTYFVALAIFLTKLK